MTIAWARQFVNLVANLAEEDVTEEDVEAGFEQFLLDAGFPIEFNDTKELDEFQKYFTEEYLPNLTDEKPKPTPKTDEEINAEFEAMAKAYADSLIYIRPVEGLNYPYFSVEKDPEGGGRECYNMDEEGLERLKQRVHGRAIAWQNGWNVFAERELTVSEFNHLVKKYLDYVK